MKIANLFCCLLSFLVVGLIATRASADIVSNFDDGTFQGWVNVAPAEFQMTNPGFGGNPAGYLAFTDLNSMSVDPPLIRAASQFSGDLTQYSNFRYDVFVIADAFRYPAVIVEGGNGSFWAYRPAFGATETWVTVTAPINDGTGWVPSGLNTGPVEPFADTIGDIKNVYVSPTVSTVVAFESGIDNFTLVVPEPASAAILTILAGCVGFRRRRTLA